MVGTRSVLKLKDVIERAEQGILDDTTDTESILDMDIDVNGVEAVLPPRIAQALTEAAAPDPAPSPDGSESHPPRSATTRP